MRGRRHGFVATGSQVQHGAMGGDALACVGTSKSSRKCRSTPLMLCLCPTYQHDGLVRMRERSRGVVATRTPVQHDGVGGNTPGGCGHTEFPRNCRITPLTLCLCRTYLAWRAHASARTPPRLRSPEVKYSVALRVVYRHTKCSLEVPQHPTDALPLSDIPNMEGSYHCAEAAKAS